MKKVQTPLFQGITENEWNEMQNCSCMRQQSFEKNELIFRMGESVREIGIVLTGSVNIENVDLWGNKSLLSNISAGQVFAETYAFCQEPLMVNAVAAEYTNLLFLNLETLMQPRYQDTLWTDKIMQNLLRISIYKNLILSNRIFCTTPKTIRGRLLIYLSLRRPKPKARSFKFLLTDRNWQIISTWIAVPSRKNLEKCVTKEFWNSAKVNSFFTSCRSSLFSQTTSHL